MAQPTYVQFHEASGIANITLDRPERLNALSSRVLRDVFDRVSELEARPIAERPRVLVLRGAGDKAFAAGADISELSSLDPTTAREVSETGHRLGHALDRASFPSIALVQGFALGGGLELALAADLIFCSEQARFGQPEINLGVIPGFGGTFRLLARVGPGWARRLVYSGEMIDAQQAAAIGLVDGVFPHAELENEAQRFAQKLAAKAPLALAAAKRCLQQNRFADFGSAAATEAAAFAELFGTEDAREGLRAFVEKRAPSFNGR